MAIGKIQSDSWVCVMKASEAMFTSSIKGIAFNIKAINMIRCV